MNTLYLSPIFDRYFGNGGYAVVALLGFALLAAWTAGVFFTRLPLARRLILATLRLLVIALLLVAMLRPTREFTDARPQPATVVVLIDASRSMTVKDAFNGRSRWEALLKALEDSAPALARMAHDHNYEIKPYLFDADARAIEYDGRRIVISGPPTGDQTAIGVAMEDVLRREGSKRLAAFILLSDGALNTVGSSSVLPQTAARTLSQLGCPLFVVPFGQRLGAGQTPDVEVESMPDDMRVFVKNDLTVSGTVRIWGYANRDIPLQLLFELEPGKLEPVDSTILRATRDGQQIHYELHYTPEKPGEYRIAVRAAAQLGEKTLDNNELSTYVNVLPGGVRVLYLEGEPRREQTFLRRALNSSRDIKVDVKWIRTTQRNHWPLASLDGVPIGEYFDQDKDKSNKFDVYIIGDLDSAALSNEDWGRLKKAVLRGAGLIMLGGWHSFWPGGYQQTPLLDILPVAYDPQLEASVRQRFEEYIAPDNHLEGEQRMRPAAPLGTRHYIMQLVPGSANLAAWQRLTPLDGANRFRGIRQGATVLAENSAGEPLLAASEPGGRVLAFAGDSTWRWVMHGQGEAHRRFWRQVVLWLARKDQVTQGNVWVGLDARRFMPGMPIRFTAGANSPEGSPISGATFSAALVLPDGSRRPLTHRRHDDEIEGEITDRLAPGQYTIEVSASNAAAPIGVARAGFSVYYKDLEMTNSTADPELLASLAEATKAQGGRTVPPEELGRLFEQLAAKPVTMEVNYQVTVTYWDRWYFFLALVGTMSVEWFLRKKWRLV